MLVTKQYFSCLLQAAKQGIKKLASAVDREQLFLKDESFDSSLFSDFSQHNPDDVSNIILSHFHSTDKTAIECSADGDCLFNAFSICLVGNESRSLEMRYRCCIEMVSNKTRIMQHRLYPRLTIISPDFEKDCLECTKPGSYSSVWRLIALSNALNIPVKSVYPSINGTKYIPFQVLNHTFNPPFADMTKGPITIMWTNITLPDQCKRFVKLKNRKEWTPNHFVPLVNLEKQDLEKNNTDSDHSEVSICEDPENKDTKQGYVYGGRTEYDRDQTKLGKNQSDDYDNHDKDVCPENSGDSSDALSGDQRHVSILVEDDSDVDMFEARGLKDRKGMFNISLKEKKGIQVSKDIKNEILGENESDDDLDLGQNVKAEDGSSNQSGYPLPSGFLAIAVILEIFKTSYKVIERLPTYVKENVYFMVKNKTNIERRSKQQKSEFWDDCGTWTASTSPKQFFIFRNGKLLSIFKRSGIYCTEKIVKGKHIYTPLMPQPDRSEVFIAHRNYSKLKKFPAYKRRVTWFESRPKEFSYIPTDVAIIEYVGNFLGRCSHGNAKTKRTLEEGYVRTNSAVMAKLAEKVKQTNPKSVFDEMNSDKSLSEHERQRNLKQIQNIKYLKKRGARSDNSASTNMADHVIRVENMVHEHEFVQQVFTDKCKPVCIVLFTDDQIKDMKRSCCVDTGSVLAFDKTFNLGQVFVTSSVYKNTAVVRKSTNKNPIFFGPIFIHGTSDYETYNSFMQKLSVKLTDEDISNMIIGSDDETAMRKACRKAFPSARHIVCTRHLKTNTLHYLVDKVGLDRKSRSEIVNAIFGMHGLVSASDIDTFNHRLKFVKGIISKHENSKAEDKSFAKYFRTRLLPLLKEHVLVPASRKELDK